ncbi:unnamed protein product [Agarophyton chilense]
MLTAGKIEQAKARIALYQVRRRGSVPISVLSSVALACQLKNPSPDPYTQRLSLSMTITRLVNGLTDRIQPRAQGATARSVYGLAVELGLPLTLVDIRHQSCHNLLPRLTALESGAKQALFWLEQFYWKPQHTNLINRLPKSLLDLKVVFESRPGHTHENVGFDYASFLSTNLCSEDDEVDTTVYKINTIIRKLQSRGAQYVRQLPIYKNSPSRKRWRRCKNPEAWKRLSLGLIPGQTRPPRLKEIKIYSGSLSIEGDDVNDTPHKYGASSKQFDGLPMVAISEESARKRNRIPTAGEVEKIETLTNHFTSLVAAQDS